MHFNIQIKVKFEKNIISTAYLLNSFFKSFKIFDYFNIPSTFIIINIFAQFKI